MEPSMSPLTIFLGKDDHDAKDRVHRKGVLFSAELITGEALIGIFMAIPIVASGKADVLALPASLHLGQWRGWSCWA
jgi:hypothetical protein